MNKIESLLHESPDILIADPRYGFISGLAREIVTRKADRKRISSIIDRFVLNRILGIPIFLAIMYLLFWVTISVGGAFIDFFDIAFGALFVDGFGQLLGLMGSPEWLTAILAGGIGDRGYLRPHHIRHVLHAFTSGGFGLHGPRGFCHGPLHARDRPSRQILRSHAGGLRLHGSGHHGHAHTGVEA
jgi:hypothetical protein